MHINYIFESESIIQIDCKMKIKRTLPSVLQNFELQSLSQMSKKKLFSKKSLDSPQRSHIQILNEGPTQHKNQIQNIYGRRKRIFSTKTLEKKPSLETFLSRKENQFVGLPSNKQFFVLNLANQKQFTQNRNNASFKALDNTQHKKRVSFGEYQNAKDKSISKQTQQYLANRTNHPKKEKSFKQLQAEQMINKINQLQGNLKRIQTNMQPKTVKERQNLKANSKMILNDRAAVDQVLKSSGRNNQNFQDLIKEYQESANIKDSKLRVLQLQLERMNRCQRLARQNQLLFQQLKQALVQEDRILEESFVGIPGQNSNRFAQSLKQSPTKKTSNMVWPSHDRIIDNQFSAQQIAKQRIEQSKQKSASKSPRKHHIFSPLNSNKNFMFSRERPSYQPSPFKDQPLNQKQLYERNLSPLSFAKISQLEKQTSPHFLFSNIENFQYQMPNKTIQISRNLREKPYQIYKQTQNLRTNMVQAKDRCVFQSKYNDSPIGSQTIKRQIQTKDHYRKF